MVKPRPLPVKPSFRRPPEERLDSWKEIASYLNRNIRTVQRWERLEQLPVRRHTHRKSDSIHAYKSEIDEWRERRQPLQEWLNAAEPSEEKRLRLAVLPFQNFFGNGDDEEYFADGLTEEMIAQLGRSHPQEMGVIARTSVMQYKGTDKSIEQIGKELRVDAILEGSVRRSGDRLRITAQLIRAKDQSHLWAESYDRGTADVLEIQTSVAEQIAKALELQLLPKHRPLAAKATTQNAEAYDAYLRGRYFWNRRTDAEFFRGIEYLKRAVELDPQFAQAHSGLADIYNTLGWYGVLTGKEAWERAEASARKALAIDPNLAEAHTSLAFALHSFAWDWEGSEREHRRSLELDRNYVIGHLWYAFFLMAMNRLPEAEQQMKEALALDPLSLVLNAYYGWILYFARKYDEAIEQVLKTLDMDPHFLIAHYILGLLYARKGQGLPSIREFKKARDLVGETVLVLSGLAHTYGLAGKAAEGQRYLEKLRKLARKQNVSPYHIAFGCVVCGAKDQAIRELERALAERASWLPLLQVEPGWDGLRKNPQFAQLVSRLRFPE